MNTLKQVSQVKDAYPFLDPTTIDTATGLWWRENGAHTPETLGASRVRSAPDSASRLVIAAQSGRLDALPTDRVLEGLAAMQEREGRHRGCFRWFAEDDRVRDTNVAFFIGLCLLVLRIAYDERLDEASRRTLDAMLPPLADWFTAERERPSLHYPNKVLGHAVCDVLLTQVLDDATEHAAAEKALWRACEAMRDGPWGWGEHLSDTYSTIMLDQLSLLLLLGGDRLDAATRGLCLSLLNELLAIEDAYDGPRVPALRSYAFQAPPVRTNYRDLVRPVAELTAEQMVWEPGRQASMLLWPNFGPLLCERGWHELVASRGVAKGPAMPAPARYEGRQERESEGGREVRVACLEGAEAVAWCEPGVRLGTVNQFPLMPMAEHRGSGLAWQSMPVAVWLSPDAGDAWGYLEWSARTGETQRHHPARDKAAGRRTPAVVVSADPPWAGVTRAVQRGPHALVVRQMERIDVAWEALGDGLRLVGPGAERGEAVEEVEPGLLRIGRRRPVWVRRVGLVDDEQPLLEETSDGSVTWAVTHSAEPLRKTCGYAAVWALSIADPPPPPAVGGAGPGGGVATAAAWSTGVAADLAAAGGASGVAG